MPDTVAIFDTTLRDGEQAAGTRLGCREKLIVARQLANLRVDVIEAGYPASSPEDFASVQSIGREIEGPTICALSRAVSADIEACAKALDGCKRPRIHTGIGVSDLHILGKFRDERYGRDLREKRARLIEMAVEAVRLARSAVGDVEFYAEDAGRAEIGYVLEMIRAVVDAGATVVNIPDTTGYAVPEQYGALIRSVGVTEPREVERKVERARRAQPDWARRDYDARTAILRAFRDLLAAEAEECARITTSEVGKPIAQSRNEVRAVLDRVDWNIEHVGDVIAPRVVTSEGRGAVGERITYEPVGLVAHVSAWNYPYFVGLNTIVPALLAGNAVLYKPSEHATLTGLRIVDLMHRSGVPVDVVQAVVGGAPAGAALVAAEVDMVCFTGSYGTGRRVARAVSDRLLRLQLELGGKDGAYVCDDVDVDSAALAVAEGAFYNAGQSCSAIERVFVHDAIFGRFVDALADAVGAYLVGDPEQDTTDIGPLARAAQLDVLDAQVADACAKGARVVCGGKRIERPGAWFEPTVLVDVDPTMSIMRDESFGPVVGVQRVRDDAEALVALDDTEFGLGAAVFSRDRARAERILGRLDVGNAYWNCSDRSSVRLPWAWRRHSGLGVSLSESGARAFVREKAWHSKPEPEEA